MERFDATRGNALFRRVVAARVAPPRSKRLNSKPPFFIYIPCIVSPTRLPSRAPPRRGAYFFVFFGERTSSLPTRRRASLGGSRFPGRSRLSRFKDARELALSRSLSREKTFRAKVDRRRRLVGLLGGLVDERLVDVGDHTTTGDGGLDQGVELLVTADGELEVAGGDALDLWDSGSCGRRRQRRASIRRGVCGKKETDRKTFFERIQTRLDGLSTGGVRDPERKRAGKRRGRAVRAAMSAGRTLRSLEALPASSRTSAVRYSAGRESERESCERPRVSESSWKQRLSNRRGWLEGTRRRRARAGRRGDAPRIAAEYTAAVAPTRPPEAARF